MLVAISLPPPELDPVSSAVGKVVLAGPGLAATTKARRPEAFGHTRLVLHIVSQLCPPNA
eukprot:12506369-Alexandrium_andersonii.AAC.1